MDFGWGEIAVRKRLQALQAALAGLGKAVAEGAGVGSALDAAKDLLRREREKFPKWAGDWPDKPVAPKPIAAPKPKAPKPPKVPKPKRRSITEIVTGLAKHGVAVERSGSWIWIGMVSAKPVTAALYLDWLDAGNKGTWADYRLGRLT